MATMSLSSKDLSRELPRRKILKSAPFFYVAWGGTWKREIEKFLAQSFLFEGGEQEIFLFIVQTQLGDKRTKAQEGKILKLLFTKKEKRAWDVMQNFMITFQ